MTPSSPPPRSPAWRGLPASLVCSLLVLLACGGESTKPPESSHTASAKAAPEKPSASEGSEAEAETESTPRSTCEDGTCFECGSGTCPQGWYCDENAKGGAACSWLPECGKKLDCACIEKTLGSGCACSEADSGLHVTCK
ncbi:MAG TPA: hypothetical protein VG937_01175 [Polyangiaceae bacterium]|nr:hypothetical protein [Polyangiaceae bacterium]